MTSTHGAPCSACSAPVAADWSFCRACGQPSSAPDLVNPHAPAIAAVFAEASPAQLGDPSTVLLAHAPGLPAVVAATAAPLDPPLAPRPGHVAAEAGHVPVVPLQPLPVAQAAPPQPAAVPVAPAQPVAAEPPVTGLDALLAPPHPPLPVTSPAPFPPSAGSPLPSAPPGSLLPSASPRPVWQQPRPLFALVAVIALIGGLLAFGVVTRRDLGQTRATLATTEKTLATTRTDLATTQETVTALTAEKASLEAELATVKKQVEDAESDLSSARTTLAGTQETVSEQESRIGDLKDCLDGVSAALLDLANGYYQSALAELQSVSGQCDRARNTY